MTEDRYKNLEAACGGRITIEALENFPRVIREYEEFMEMGRRMFAPLDEKEKSE